MPDPFDTDTPDPGDAQAGAGYAPFDVPDPLTELHGRVIALEAKVAGLSVAAPAPAGGIVDNLIRNAARRFVAETFTPARLLAAEDALLTQLHELAATLGRRVAGLPVWDQLGVTVRPDWAEWWWLRATGRLDERAVADWLSRTLLAALGPLVDGVAADRPADDPAPAESPRAAEGG